MSNGNISKPSWLSYVAVVGVVITLLTVFTKAGTSWGTETAGSTLLGQTVAKNKIEFTKHIEKAEGDFKELNKEIEIVEDNDIAKHEESRVAISKINVNQGIVTTKVEHIITEQIEIKADVNKLVESNAKLVSNDVEILKILNELKDK